MTISTHLRIRTSPARSLAVAFCCIASCASLAAAQERRQVAEQREATASPRVDNLSISLTPTYEHVFDTDLRASQGSVQINRAGAELELGGPLGDRARWGVTAAYEVSWYNFNNTPDLIPSGANPFQEVHSIRITPTLAYSIDQQWSVLGGPIIQFAGERDAEVADSGTYGGFFAVNYAASEALSLSLGVTASSQLESDARVIPFLGVTWRINDTLTLRTRGPRVELVAKACDQLSARIFGAYQARDYRLSNDSEIPEGVVRDRRGRIGFGLDWHACSAATITLETGVDVYQRFYFDDKNGERVGADRTKPAPFVALRADIRF